MRFEWDEAKRGKNLRQHGFDFLDSEEIFAAQTHSVVDDRFDYGEGRIVTFGMLNGTVVAITHTESDEVTRIISIRKALKNEEEIYYKEIRD
jgi:uncharacterized DUF497 family protein